MNTHHRSSLLLTTILVLAQLAAQADVTSPGSFIRGVPDDGDWPAGEAPALAIDDNINTKYLHFKGETQSTGFQVTPLAGATVVTELILTTANDAPERDPVAFELSGSNVSIDGPYTLIARGDDSRLRPGDGLASFHEEHDPDHVRQHDRVCSLSAPVHAGPRRRERQQHADRGGGVRRRSGRRNASESIPAARILRRRARP